MIFVIIVDSLPSIYVSIGNDNILLLFVYCMDYLLFYKYNYVMFYKNNLAIIIIFWENLMLISSPLCRHKLLRSIMLKIMLA